MIRHSGAAVLLSGVVLVLAAVLLYRGEALSEAPERAEKAVEAVARKDVGDVPDREEAAPVETPVREEPVPEEPAVVRRPEAPFTLCEPGETLKDVARRVYGSAEMAGPLREVNRDLVARIDEPVKPGLALRTPPLQRVEAP